MRAFLAAFLFCRKLPPVVLALMLSVATVGAAWSTAPYQRPLSKDQARVAVSIEPEAMASVDLVDEPAWPAQGVVMASLHPVEFQPVVPSRARRLSQRVEGRSDTWLLDKARSYRGTNPTGWARLWCAKFIAMLAPDLAKRIHNPNWARDWASLPKAKPRPGVIVVVSRGRGGHIGVLDRFDRHGNPILVSGNTWNRQAGRGRVVAEGVYSKHRVLAYVSPNG